MPRVCLECALPSGVLSFWLHIPNSCSQNVSTSCARCLCKGLPTSNTLYVSFITLCPACICFLSNKHFFKFKFSSPTDGNRRIKFFVAKMRLFISFHLCLHYTQVSQIQALHSKLRFHVLKMLASFEFRGLHRPSTHSHPACCHDGDGDSENDNWYVHGHVENFWGIASSNDQHIFGSPLDICQSRNTRITQISWNIFTNSDWQYQIIVNAACFSVSDWQTDSFVMTPYCVWCFLFTFFSFFLAGQAV